MGKRKSKKKSASAIVRQPRKESYESERMISVVDRMREQAARINGLARAMDDAGIDEIVVDGHAMLLRGLNQIDNFIDNSSRSVREAKTALAHH